MAIQDEMYKAIEKEINQTVESGAEKVAVNFEKAKAVGAELGAVNVVVVEFGIGNKEVNRIFGGVILDIFRV